jgi:hypothetical protein
VRSKMKRKPPKPPKPPEEPYEFGDFVRILQKDVYYARAIHKIVEYSRSGEAGAEDWACDHLNKHVIIDSSDLSTLDIPPDTDLSTSRCSNNTKFFMLDFARFV